MFTSSNAAGNFPGVVVSSAPGTKASSFGTRSHATTSPQVGRNLSTRVCASPAPNSSARSGVFRASSSPTIVPRSQPDLQKVGIRSIKAVQLGSCSPLPKFRDCCGPTQPAGTDQTGKACDGHAPENSSVGENHGIKKELSLESMQFSFDKILYSVEQKILERVKLQCHDWQTNVDSRLNALEDKTQKDANKVVSLESRFSAMEYCMESLLELCALYHKQSLDLSDKVAKTKTMESGLEENWGQTLQEDVHHHDVEQKRQSNELTPIPEDGHPVTDEHVGGGGLAQKQERPKQQGPDQKQELANSEDSFAHRLCVVECNIDQLTSILKIIESGLSNMNGQAPANNGAESICGRSNQKSTNNNTMQCSGEAFESSGAACQPGAVPLVCCQHSVFSKESACVHEHEGHRALIGRIADRQQQEDANAQLEHGHSQLQFMLGKARKYLEQAVPLNGYNVSHKCSTVVEESHTAAQMRTNSITQGCS